MANPDSKLPFLEIIEWVEENPNLLMRKICDSDKEIKNGAKLIVRESQKAMFLNEGTIADIFEAGTHTLKTQNIPVLSKLKGWKYGFESPFKADIYYFSVTQFVNLKWGTPAPILMRDSQFGQVRIKAFGSYNVRIKDIAKFFKEYAGTFPILTIFELENQLRDFIAPKFGEVIAQSGISVLDLAGNMTELSAKIRPLITPYFENLGVEVTEFAVSSVTLPTEVTKHFDDVTSMNMVGDMNRYTQFQTAKAIGEEGNPLQNNVQQGTAMGMMLGAMQQQMQNSNSSQNQSNAPTDDVASRLQKLKTLFENGLIDEEEFKAKKAEIIAEL
ncbi:SPFH domain-containing protein [Weeksellaceae bacterium TAE3-ERU29]|nr:SPFH domain-containing protein [Weeksellaceae bacterium TAE3-ERU29]